MVQEQGQVQGQGQGGAQYMRTINFSINVPGIEGKLAINTKSYDAMHRERSNKDLALLAKAGRHLSPLNSKLCIEYAREVLGGPQYAPSLQVYAAFAGVFKEGWIPNNYYGTYVVPTRNGAYGNISARRGLAFPLLQSDALPDRLYLINGRFFDRDMNPVPEGMVAELVFRSEAKAVFKLDSSQKGRGVHILQRSDFSTDKLFSLGEGVLQQFVQQHDILRQLSPDAVATLRLTTVADPSGLPVLKAAFLRMGRAGDKHVGFDNEIEVAIDIHSGGFHDFAYMSNWEPCTHHPDTGYTFRNQILPGYPESVALVLELHRKLCYVQNIGWDIAINTEGKPVLMEWNGGHNDIVFSEATTGPCFKGLGWEHIHKTHPHLNRSPRSRIAKLFHRKP